MKSKKITTAPLDPATLETLRTLSAQTGVSVAKLSSQLLKIGAVAFSEHCQQRGRNIGGGHGS